MSDAAARGITTTDAVTPEVIASVDEILRPYLRRTPVLGIDRADFGLAPGPLALKLEHLQHSGSFKARGAFANLLLRGVPEAGVVAASGGNHGAAVAYAAHVRGVPARIYVPEVSSPAKISRIRGYGAELVVTGATYAEAHEASGVWAAGSGALPVPAFDQIETILGAATLAVELERQVGQTATVLASVGGGGLLAGIAGWCVHRTRVVGAEPESAPTLTRALAAGRPVDAPAGGVAVDSLAPRRVGEHTFRIISRYVDQVVLVTDDQIRQAQEILWDRLRLVAEPGGCAALAAVLAGRYLPAPDEAVTVVISGANTTAVSFAP
ncbi:threonine/serine dehydratase [Frankia sp. CNm7]|uniref:Threonine/serine dehydratase n=1 Tax=Frankia nepalensis TaxID=1836974 RepID=A0A937UKY3_9ACTN|nr:threonine/serine dehydratase [Frankia nepalensis]MBL7499212.1 threonine/serine dehydratase [Frankia nepalensis]MBL7516233.1 threonine/serine dehydratase [Frankia nepalensis]MBL7524887.1 threonine/serine dehydratase [Frankia nepalensis]MBL7627284.1 threonine/serine dehydratase [Frankia nepalensis]